MLSIKKTEHDHTQIIIYNVLYEKDLCGKCPLCKDRYSYFKSREKEYWPSDRLFKCDKFKGMTIKEKFGKVWVLL